MSPALLLMLTVQMAGTPGPDAGTSPHRLRTIDPIVSAVIREGKRRSPTFAALVDIVDRSDTFVYVVRAHTLPHGMEGCLVHEDGNSRYRYLKVFLLMGTPSERMIAVLAHELQHVHEVLNAGISTDQAAMDALFKRIGIPQLGTDTGEQYETTAAQEVMAVVARELRTSRPRAQP
jgi:hypothetical protein